MSDTRKIDVIFYAVNPDTLEVIGGERFVCGVELSPDAIAGAAMVKLDETSHAQHIAQADAFRTMIEAIGITVKLKLAEALKRELHP